MASKTAGYSHRSALLLQTSFGCFELMTGRMKVPLSSQLDSRRKRHDKLGEVVTSMSTNLTFSEMKETTVDEAADYFELCY